MAARVRLIVPRGEAPARMSGCRGGLVFAGEAGRADKADDVVLHPVIDIDIVHQFAARDHGFGIDHGAGFGLRRGSGHAIEDDPFFRHRRVIDDDFEKESVELRFGELVGAFLIDGVLGRENEERIGKAVGGVPYRDLALLHRLEESALHFGGRPVDLVGEDEIGKDGPQLRSELIFPGIVNERSDEVGGK